VTDPNPLNETRGDLDSGGVSESGGPHPDGGKAKTPAFAGAFVSWGTWIRTMTNWFRGFPAGDSFGPKNPGFPRS